MIKNQNQSTENIIKELFLQELNQRTNTIKKLRSAQLCKEDIEKLSFAFLIFVLELYARENISQRTAVNYMTMVDELKDYPSFPLVNLISIFNENMDNVSLDTFTRVCNALSNIHV